MGIKTLSRVLMESMQITPNFHQDYDSVEFYNIRISEICAKIAKVEDNPRVASLPHDTILDLIKNGIVDWFFISKNQVYVIFALDSSGESDEGALVTFELEKELCIRMTIPRFNKPAEKYTIEVWRKEGDNALFPEVLWEHDAVGCKMRFQNDAYVLIEEGTHFDRHPCWENV